MTAQKISGYFLILLVIPSIMRMLVTCLPGVKEEVNNVEKKVGVGIRG